MKRRQFLTMAGASITTTVAGCSGGNPEYEDSNGGGSGDDDDDANVEEDVEILEHELVREDEGTMAESVSVKGRAENTSDENFSYTEIRVRFYNEDGDLLDSSLDNINDFGAGQTWAFEAMFFGMGDDAAEIADYDIAVGTNF